MIKVDMDWNIVRPKKLYMRILKSDRSRSWSEAPTKIMLSALDDDHAYKIHYTSLEQIQKDGGMSLAAVYWNLTRATELRIEDVEDMKKVITNAINKSELN